MTRPALDRFGMQSGSRLQTLAAKKKEKHHKNVSNNVCQVQRFSRPDSEEAAAARCVSND